MPQMTGTAFLNRVKHLHLPTFRVILSTCSVPIPYQPWDNKTLRRNILEVFRHYEQLHEIPDALKRVTVLYLSQ